MVNAGKYTSPMDPMGYSCYIPIVSISEITQTLNKVNQSYFQSACLIYMKWRLLVCLWTDHVYKPTPWKNQEVSIHRPGLDLVKKWRQVFPDLPSQYVYVLLLCNSIMFFKIAHSGPCFNLPRKNRLLIYMNQHCRFPHESNDATQCPCDCFLFHPSHPSSCCIQLTESSWAVFAIVCVWSFWEQDEPMMVQLYSLDTVDGRNPAPVDR